MPPPPSLQQKEHDTGDHVYTQPSETTSLLTGDYAGPTTDPRVHIAISKSVPVVSVVGSVFGSDADSESDNDDGKYDDRPLDKFQVFILCYTGCMNPINFFCIFPFISQMVRNTGVPEAEVGFYTGLVESLFSITQMLVMIFWTRAAERYGRKPTLVLSSIGIAVSMTDFGFANTLGAMIAARCLAGFFSGQQVIIRIMFGCISTPRTAAQAYSLFAFSNNIGIFVGPFIGGLFSTPAEQYPALFGTVQLFARYPYALVMIVVGALTLSSALLCGLCLKEAPPSPPSDMQGKDSDASTTTKSLSSWELITTPGVTPVLFLYAWSSLIGLAYTAIIPPFWYVQPALGGYGFSTRWTSFFLTIIGAAQALWTLFVFPPWQRRKGVGAVFRTCWYLYPFVIYIHPLTSILRRVGFETAFWISAVTAILIFSAISMTYTGCQLALNDVAPTHQSLGELNAIALTGMSGIRAVAPAAFSALFAFGVKYKILGGYFIWVVLSIMSFGFWIALRYVPERALAPPSLLSPPRRNENHKRRTCYGAVPASAAAEEEVAVGHADED